RKPPETDPPGWVRMPSWAAAPGVTDTATADDDTLPMRALIRAVPTSRAEATPAATLTMLESDDVQVTVWPVTVRPSRVKALAVKDVDAPETSDWGVLGAMSIRTTELSGAVVPSPPPPPQEIVAATATATMGRGTTERRRLGEVGTLVR